MRAAPSLAILLLAAVPADGARPRPQATAPAPAATLSAARLPVTRHVLGNGMVVLLQPDRSVPTVTFWQWFKVGSRNERPGITGISHVFEHMMFNGSANVAPKEYDRIIESNGGTSNAFTDRDMTGYYEDIAADRLEVLFRLDADRMRGLRLDPAVLASELEVVREERRLRTDNDIAGLLDEHLYATAFVASPYQWPVVGWMADLERMRREDLVEYFRTYYAPNNAILALVGDFDPTTALAAIQRAFGDIPAQAAPPPPPNAEPEQRGERRVLVRHPAENVHVLAGYKTPAATDPDHATLQVLAAILAEGESSRLHRALVYDARIALEVTAFHAARLDPGLFEIHLELLPGRSATDGLAALDAELDRLVREGPEARELVKAKNLLEAGLVRGLKTNNGVGEQLAFHEHVYGDYRALYGAVDRLRAVTAEDCRRVARRTFVAERRTIAELVPTPADSTEAR